MKTFLSGFISATLLWIGAYLFIQHSSMFSSLNCTAAKVHQNSSNSAFQILLSPDYADRSEFEQLVIQLGCKIK